ncbi:MAG: ribonuclease PH [Planctomycetota bacterium]
MARDRSAGALRPVSIEAGFLKNRAGSVLYSSGATRVLCVASLEEGVPRFRVDSGLGWATSEYELMPGSTVPRNSRERGGKLSGRTQEIQRLIGRSLRAVLDFEALSGYTLKIDCDVVEADGGTRTASISGAYVAAQLAFRDALEKGQLKKNPFAGSVAAVSVGIVDGVGLLDLDYSEDSKAEVDLNVVTNGEGALLEVQGTAEGRPFSRAQLDELLDLAEGGLQKIRTAQAQALGDA